jgi:hypothetical protein
MKFFPYSTVTKVSHGEGYVATVADKDGAVLFSEFGKTLQDAWRNAFVRVCQIWKPVLSVTAIATLLVTANQSEPI